MSGKYDSTPQSPVQEQLQPGDEVLDDDSAGKNRFRRKVIRRKEVPFVRQVKVPITRQKVIPTSIQKKIPIKLKRQVDDFEEVEEQYTDFVEEKGIREKKVWVEETVMEDYTKKVPETIVRLVKKPITRVEEVQVYETVEVATSREEMVRGWRVDEIEERKLVEVDEWEVYEFIPHSTHQIVDGETRDLGSGSRVANHRVIGKRIYFPAKLARDAEELAGVALDELVDEHHVQPRFRRNDDGSWESVGYTAGVGDSYLDATPKAQPLPQPVQLTPLSGVPLKSTALPHGYSWLDTAPHWAGGVGGGAEDNTTAFHDGGDIDGHGWDVRDKPRAEKRVSRPPSRNDAAAGAGGVGPLTAQTAAWSLHAQSLPRSHQPQAQADRSSDAANGTAHEPIAVRRGPRTSGGGASTGRPSLDSQYSADGLRDSPGAGRSSRPESRGPPIGGPRDSLSGIEGRTRT